MNNFSNVMNFIRELEHKTKLGEITWIKNGECYETSYNGEIYFVISKERREIMVIISDIPSLSMQAEKMVFNTTHVVFWEDVYHLYCIIESSATERDPHE